MSKITCIIVEDEPLAAKVLKDYIEQLPFLDLKGIFKDAILALDYLQRNTVDLMFLDIHLPRLKGMAFLKSLIDPPLVIITTAYHQYAVEGFNQNVIDYLLKPIDFERFLIGINKVRKSMGESSQSLNAEPVKDYFFISVQKRNVKISLSDIMYIESQREYIKIVTSNTEYLTKMSTHEIEAFLPSDQFRRIHRSFIIAVKKIQSFTSEEVEVNGILLPVGRTYKSSLDGL
jgi:two-component system LytT family response regulator